MTVTPVPLSSKSNQIKLFVSFASTNQPDQSAVAVSR